MAEGLARRSRVPVWVVLLASCGTSRGPREDLADALTGASDGVPAVAVDASADGLTDTPSVTPIDAGAPPSDVSAAPPEVEEVRIPDAAAEASEASAASPDTPVHETGATDPLACTVDVASGWSTVPEASGAVRFPDGRLLVVADSGHFGKALWILPDGRELPVTLPLDGPRDAEGRPTDDDLEGLSLGPDGDLFGLTSAGWLRRWRRVGDTLELVGASTPLAPDEALACASRAVNCGPNYEGLCLRPGVVPIDAPRGDSPPANPNECVGFAASKARGELVCLVWVADLDDGPPRLRATALALPTGLPPDQLSDCAFPTERVGEAVLLAGNLYAGSGLWWFSPASGALTPTGVTGPPNQEAIVATGRARWRAFGDLQSLSPNSPWLDFACGDGS